MMERTRSARTACLSLYRTVLEVLLTGFAIIVPLVVTLYILELAVGFVADAIGPFVGLLDWLGLRRLIGQFDFLQLLSDVGVYPFVFGYVRESIAVLVLLGIVVLVGAVGRHGYGAYVIEYADVAIASIPGVGTIYTSFRRIGDLMVEQEADQFREVKLIQLLGADTYVLGFETGRAPDTVAEVTGTEDMVTMFVPLAPNPVTGGFLTYVPRDRVHSLDMSIEEGVRSILTSGVADGERRRLGDLPAPTIEGVQDALAQDGGDGFDTMAQDD